MKDCCPIVDLGFIFEASRPNTNLNKSFFKKMSNPPE